MLSSIFSSFYSNVTRLNHFINHLINNNNNTINHQDLAAINRLKLNYNTSFRSSNISSSSISKSGIISSNKYKITKQRKMKRSSNTKIKELDPDKPMPLYINSNNGKNIQQLLRKTAINFQVARMDEDIMEKEEETEHHLQKALKKFGKNDYFIPTPRYQEIDVKTYEKIYKFDFTKPKLYVKHSANQNDYPDYDADLEDEQWLKQKRASLPKDFIDDLTLYFECIMDRLEKITAHSMNLTALKRAKYILDNELNSHENNLTSICYKKFNSRNRFKYKKENEQFLLDTYNYWKAKRLKFNHPLTPIYLNDKSIALTQPNNPYLVFTESTDKMYSSRRIELKKRCLNKIK